MMTSLHILVKAVRDQCTVFDEAVDSTTLVAQLKTRLELICHAKPSDQRLFFSGSELEDEAALGDCGLQAGSVIRLVSHPLPLQPKKCTCPGLSCSDSPAGSVVADPVQSASHEPSAPLAALTLEEVLARPDVTENPAPLPFDPLATEGMHITGVHPQQGLTCGGSTVTLTGCFPARSCALACRFGSTVVPARHLSYAKITTIAPPHGAGAVSLEVTADGASYTSEGAMFTYIELGMVTHSARVPADAPAGAQMVSGAEPNKGQVPCATENFWANN